MTAPAPNESAALREALIAKLRERAKHPRYGSRGSILSRSDQLALQAADALARTTTTDADLAKARGEIETIRIESGQLRRALEEAHRGLRMIHDGLADPTRPRQSVGEVAAYWVAEIGSHLTDGGDRVEA